MVTQKEDHDGMKTKIKSSLVVKEFRGAIGKLNWLQESTRPDLRYDTLKNRTTMMGDLKKMNKVIRKAKEGADESKIQYKKIDKCRRKDPVSDQWEEGQSNPLEKQEDQQGGRQYQKRRDSGNG